MLGEQIKYYRKQMNLSQAELSAKLNCKQQVISRWEKNRDSPSMKIILKLCRALEISINNLMEEN